MAQLSQSCKLQVWRVVLYNGTLQSKDEKENGENSLMRQLGIGMFTITEPNQMTDVIIIQTVKTELGDII